MPCMQRKIIRTIKPHHLKRSWFVMQKAAQCWLLWKMSAPKCDKTGWREKPVSNWSPRGSLIIFRTMIESRMRMVSLESGRGLLTTLAKKKVGNLGSMTWTKRKRLAEHIQELCRLVDIKLGSVRTRLAVFLNWSNKVSQRENAILKHLIASYFQEDRIQCAVMLSLEMWGLGEFCSSQWPVWDTRLKWRMLCTGRTCSGDFRMVLSNSPQTKRFCAFGGEIWTLITLFR